MTTVFQHCLLVNYAIAPEALTRAVVRCGSRRGVYFLRSGNHLSFFRFHHAMITWTQNDTGRRIRVKTKDGSADIDLTLGADPLAALPGGCAFSMPTELVTTPPRAECPVPRVWPAGLSVLCQDWATHPGSSVHGVPAKL
jgi:hypothetical protein